MTVLSRSKNAAARVTRHDCKWSRSARGTPRAVHTRTGHPQFFVRLWHCLPARCWAPCACPPHRAPVRPALSSSAPTTTLLDDLLRLLAAAGAEPELATGGPALRRAHRNAPLVLVGADALGERRSPVAARGVRAWSSSTAGELPAAEWAAAVELGAERVAVLPADEAWLLARAVRAVAPPSSGAGSWPSAAAAGEPARAPSRLRVALAAAPGVLLVDGDPWGGGLDLLLGAERADGLRWPDLTGLRGRVAGDALLAALPEVRGRARAGVVARDAPSRCPTRRCVAVVEAARSVGLPGRRRSRPRGRPPMRPRCSPTPTSPSSWCPAGCGRRRRRGCWWRRPVRPWSAAQLVVGRVPGGLSRGTRSPTSSAGRCSPSCRTTAAPCRGANGASHRTWRRARRSAAWPGGSSRRCAPAPASRGCRPASTALLDRVRARLALDPEVPRRASVAALVREETGGLLGDDDVLRAVREAVDELAGAGPLEPLLREPGVTDVLVNGPDRGVDRPGRRPASGRAVRFADDDAVRRLAVRLAGPRRTTARRRGALGGRRAARRHPAARGPAAGVGQRAPACPCGCSAAARTRLDDLAALGTLPGESGALLRALVAAPAGLPRHRRHRLGQDDAAVGPAGRVRPGRADRRLRGRRRADARRIRTSSGCSPGRRTSRASGR